MVERAIPTEQWAIQQYAGGKWEIERIPVPVPGPGQVLVRMECAPVNPSDTYFLSGQYDKLGDGKITFPLAPGWEGSGTVVASGGGFMAWRVMGKRCAVTKCDEPNGEFKIGGCYQQYMVTAALQCMPLADDVSFEDGAMHCVNPFTALGLIDSMKKYKGQAFIQTAAASQLGRMIVRIALDERIPMINIVRKEDQEKLLRDMGCEHVLNSTDPDFLEKLGELAKQLRATVCFEAIGGTITGQIMSKMPSGSTCIIYGCLSEQNIGDIDPLLLIGRNQKLVPFLLNLYLGDKSLWYLAGLVKKVQNLMRNKTLHSVVQKRISLFELKDGLEEYKKNMTAGKYLIYPQQDPPSGYTPAKGSESAGQQEENKQE